MESEDVVDRKQALNVVNAHFVHLSWFEEQIVRIACFMWYYAKKLYIMKLPKYIIAFDVKYLPMPRTEGYMVLYVTEQRLQKRKIY